jgi:glutamine amidotransferase
LIHVVDYGLGNVEAFLNLYKRLGYPATRAKVASDLENASKIILPGVGSFDYAMKLLNTSGMRPMLEKLVLGNKVPILGVCVGMQILANSSDEGSLAGLGWLDARVLAFSKNEKAQSLPVPHMGWNHCSPKLGHPLFSGFKAEPSFYFLHSYYFKCEKNEDISATANYGMNFCSAVSRNNIHGVQFHPEKSHDFGERLLKNFAEIPHVAT